MADKSNVISPQPLTVIIPSSALPPLEGTPARFEALKNAVYGSLWQPYHGWGLYLESAITQVLQVLTLFGNIQGLALAAQEDTLDETNVEVLPLPCKLAYYFTGEVATAFLKDLGSVLRSPDILAVYPELTQAPQAGENLLWASHNEMAGFTDLYPLIATDLQKGLVKKWQHFGWVPEKYKTLSSYLTGLRRVAALIDPQQYHDLSQPGSEAAMRSFLRMLVDRLDQQTATDEILKESTKRAYLNGICTSLGRREWFVNPDYQGSTKGWQKRYTITQLMRMDDDLPECSDAPDVYRAPIIQVLIDNQADALTPWDILLKEPAAERDAEEAAKERKPGDAEGRAVSQAYLDPFEWHCTAPEEMTWLLQRTLQQAQAGQITEAVKNLILSLVLTGRKISWLLSVHLGDAAKTGQWETPVYDRQTGVVHYTPQVLSKDFPLKPMRTEDLFIPVEKTWCLPLPACLQVFWDALAKGKRKGAALFADLTEENVKAYLKEMTDEYHQRHAHTPAYTEGRLRNSAYTMLVKVGGMVPVYVAMIMDIWKPNVRVPLYYTTVSCPHLAERYHQALERVWASYRIVEPKLPVLKMQPNQELPQVWQGSPYRPKLDVVRAIVQQLTQTLKTADTPQARYNAITLCALYGLNLFCGLRIGETHGLTASQFNLAFAWRGQPMPLLTIPDAKTNRFALAARSIPLTQHIVPLIQQAIQPDEKDNSAFHIHTGGTLQPLTEYRLEALREAADVTLLRWHAARQALHAGMLEAGAGFEAANAILGHESIGYEIYNRYPPNPLPEIWWEYLRYCDTWAEVINWKEVIDAIGTANTTGD